MLHLIIKNKKIFILGTGGTAKTAYKVVKDLGALEIHFVSRNKKDNAITYEELISNYAHEVEVIVSTTPYGMYPNISANSIVDLECFKNLVGVVDVVYNPLRTELIVEAKNKKKREAQKAKKYPHKKKK